MATSSETQKCAICLEDLMDYSQNNKVGAVVPCGHCLHTGCFRQWQGAAYHRRAPNIRDYPKCPICNGPADAFVPLFLDVSCTVACSADNNNNETLDSIADASTVGASNAAKADEKQEQQQELLQEELANATNLNHQEQQERIQSKLKRYKRQNKSLKKELETSQQEMETILVSTIQNFYKMLEKFEGDRTRHLAAAKVLQRQLDETQHQRDQERRKAHAQQEWMQQQMKDLKRDCEKANQRVESASAGLTELQRHHWKRQSQLQAVLQETAQLVHENRQLKKAASTQQGSVRSERIRLGPDKEPNM